MPLEQSWPLRLHDINDGILIMMTTTVLVALLLVWVVGSQGFSSFLRRDKIMAPGTDKSTTTLWWNDLAPPFNVQVSEQDRIECQQNNEQDVMHFCFLVHGHRGLSKDLSYLQAVMQALSEQEKRRRYQYDGQVQDIVVHSAVCNEGKTTDGVASGGERLLEEIMSTIKAEMETRPSVKEITVSVVGNSLGGIYARYAIAKLAQETDITIHFNIFCTTATPHLGVSKHTYLPLPRSAEIGVAHAMGDTGKDLFRLNDLMKNMATSEEFITPLGAFRKRIAYANAYGTDFPVPAETAAFLSHESTYPHHFSIENDSGCVVVDDTSGLVIATLHTPPGGEALDEHADELVQMSTALDALGWKKVFVDIRKEIPLRVSIPRRLTRLKSPSNSGVLDSSSASGSEEEAPPPDLDTLRQRGEVVESRDLATAVKSHDPNDPYHRLHLPMGHNMIVAFSRSRISTFVNKGGRPIVDALAKELVEDIFSWNMKEVAPSGTTAQ